jgi:hypothetical protein
MPRKKTKKESVQSRVARSKTAKAKTKDAAITGETMKLHPKIKKAKKKTRARDAVHYAAIEAADEVPRGVPDYQVHEVNAILKAVGKARLNKKDVAAYRRTQRKAQRKADKAAERALLKSTAAYRKEKALKAKAKKLTAGRSKKK